MTQSTRRIVLLAPNAIGNDGISTVVRQALGCWPQTSTDHLEVWTLLDESLEGARLPPARYRTAVGSKWRYASWGLREAVRDWSRDTIVAMHLSLAPVALPLTARGATLAIFLHGIECWRRLRPLEHVAIRRADRLIANSNYTAARFKEANAALSEREVAICQLGIEMKSEGPQTETARQEAPFALIVGRMSSAERYKGHDELLDLWPSVTREHPTARLVIAGEGDDRRRLEAKARDSGMGNHVRFAGRVDDRELERLYRECAFFVMPSRGEGFGLVFLEAMRAGRACIGGTGAAAEVIQDGVTGFVVNPADPAASRQAIVTLFRQPELSRRMGDAGARLLTERFTADHFRARLRAIVHPSTRQA